MKRTQLLIVMLLYIAADLAAQNMNWNLVNTGTTKHIRDISFINRDTGFIAGDNGLLKYTTDGGGTWTDMAIPSGGQGAGNTNNIKVAQFYGSGGSVDGVLFFDKFISVNRMYGWMGGWTEECGGSMFVYNDSVCSINNYHRGESAFEAYAAGNSCTHEGGMYGYFGGFCFTFDTLFTQPGFSGWNDVTSNSNGTLVMVGDDGYYYTNSGGNDTIIQYADGHNFSSVDFSDSLTVYATNYDSFDWQLKKSTDGGLTFTVDSLLAPSFWYPQISEIDFVKNDWGVMAGASNINYGMIITKRGNNIDFFLTDSILTSVYVVDSTLAFAGGLNGKLYKYELLPNAGLEPFSANIEFSVFPNPQTIENGMLNIYCKENVNAVVVSDISGKVLLNTQSNGTESLQLNTSGFVPGVYVVKIITGKGSGTKRFVVN